MTDYARVSDLPEATTLAATDLLEISQDSGGGAYASKKITAANAIKNQGSITAVFDGMGTVPAGGLKCYVSVPYACTINSWTIVADLAGSIVIDIWKTTYAGAPPSVSNTIVNGNYPALSSVQKNTSSSLGGWTTVAVSAGDVMGFNVNSASTLTKATLVLGVTKI